MICSKIRLQEIQAAPQFWGSIRLVCLGRVGGESIGEGIGLTWVGMEDHFSDDLTILKEEYKLIWNRSGAGFPTLIESCSIHHHSRFAGDWIRKKKISNPHNNICPIIKTIINDPILIPDPIRIRAILNCSTHWDWLLMGLLILFSRLRPNLLTHGWIEASQ